jgi:hypothetical protein
MASDSAVLGSLYSLQDGRPVQPIPLSRPVMRKPLRDQRGTCADPSTDQSGFITRAGAHLGQA